MSKRFKSQASSSRAASTTFGNSAFGGFTSASSQQQNAASSLSYISEPPDLSQISDPQVVVAFKNLLKKDSTTKSKALEDLQTLLNSGHSEARALEDGLLEAWVCSVPFWTLFRC
jgi:[phosphatase 2A protein]-leucine-carboxy methyltransferase